MAGERSLSSKNRMESGRLPSDKGLAASQNMMNYTLYDKGVAKRQELLKVLSHSLLKGEIFENQSFSVKALQNIEVKEGWVMEIKSCFSLPVYLKEIINVEYNEKLGEAVKGCLYSKPLHDKLNIAHSQCLQLKGDKNLIVSVAQKLDIALFYFHGCELLFNEQSLNDLIECACLCSPSIILIDGIDAKTKPKFLRQQMENTIEGYQVCVVVASEINLPFGPIIQIDIRNELLTHFGPIKDKVARLTTGFSNSQLKVLLCLPSTGLYETVVDNAKMIRGQTSKDVQVVKGYQKLVSMLITTIQRPIDNPELYIRMGIKPPQGILLYGPSGCGKTLLARWLASQVTLNFIESRNHIVYSKYLGDSEASIRSLFERAAQQAPCILFLDRIEIVGGKRGNDSGTGVNERVLSTLLNEMDGVEARDVIVVACSDVPWMIDDALLRPGRLDLHIYVGLPTALDRALILGFDGLIVTRTDAFTCADLECLRREAGMLAIIEGRSVIEERHLHTALDDNDGHWKPSMHSLDLSRYNSFGDIN